MTRWIVLAVAVLAGLVLLGYDQRTDDSGVEVALIIASAMALALVAPRVWIAVALAIGLPIAASSFLHGNPPGFLVVLFAGAGAFLGSVLRRGFGRGRA